MTPLEIRLLKCIREYRRLNNQTVCNVIESDAVHNEADELLAVLQPELDDPNERWDAPGRVEHREMVQRLFRRNFL